MYLNFKRPKYMAIILMYDISAKIFSILNTLKFMRIFLYDIVKIHNL